MPSANLEGWYYISITLKSLIDGSTTKTVKLSNRPIIDETDGATVYFPILKAINNIGSQAGDYIPSAVRGTVVLDNSPSSFGYERRFSDLLERYTILGQPVAIYSAHTAIDDTTINAEFALDWTTTGLTWEIRGNDLVLTVAEQSLSNLVLTRQIDATSWPSAPAQSIGKYLPIVFGDSIPVKPTMVTAEADVAPYFAYATNLGSGYGSGVFTVGGASSTGGVASFLAKDHLGIYQTITSPATVSTALFQNTASAGSSGGLSIADYAWGIGTSAPGSTCYVLRGGKVQLAGNSVAGTVSGQIQFKLVEAFSATIGSPNDATVIAAAVIDKADYAASFNGAGNFYVEFSFSKPAVTRPSVQYFLVMSSGNDTIGAASQVNVRANTTGGTGFWTRSHTTTGSSWVLTSSVYAVVAEFYGVTFNDSALVSTLDVSGIGFAQFGLDQKSAATGQTNPDISKLDLMVLVNGLCDDSAGTITGVASARIRSPQHVIKTLDLQPNGTTWSTTGAKIDVTRFTTTLGNVGETSSSSTTKGYPRQIGGYLEGRVTAAEMMREVCRNSGFRIARYNGSSRPFTMWAWGETQQSVATITDEDSKLINCRQLGAETVINRTILAYNKDLRYSDVVTSAGQGTLRNYASTLTADGASATYGNAASNLSISLFGRNELASNTFDLISTNLSNFAAAMVQYYLRVYPFPFVYAELEVPLFKYRTLEIMDVIEIVHPGLPAYYGSSSNARLPYYNGAVTDLLAGQYWKRGKRYRAQIEGRVLNYNIGGFPTMRLNCRLLLNFPIDPT